MAGAAAAGPGRPVQRFPRDAGYRSMCVFQGKSDRAPALYVSTMSRTGAVLLRSEDGKSFEPVCEPGFGDASIYSFRSLVEWNGWLFAAPAGTVSDGHLDRNLPPAPKIYASKDPLKGAWVEAAPPGFGDAANLAIYPVCPAFGRLYAGTANADLGCQIWQTEARGKPPFRLVSGHSRGRRSLQQELRRRRHGRIQERSLRRRRHQRLRF